MGRTVELRKTAIGGGLWLGLLLPVDADDLYALIAGSARQLSPYLPWVGLVSSVEDERVFLRDAVHRMADGQAYTVGIWEGESLAGLVSLDVDQENNSAELGYYLGVAFAGRGYMTAAASAVVSWGFSQLGLARIEVHVAVDNQRSRAVCMRMGLSSEGVARGAIRLHGRYVDRETFAALAGQWTEPRR
ncbi:MAG: GNAT family protein [Nitrospiraceae bacterium]|nr:GNAT family protein [Nitrospiraceae bacterium]MDA8210101.1 GNAT family protein [Actinomycetota bacterium]